ncbi:hypothetical protein U0070_002280 [Myodes glareolus]|uniref:G-protein coupled receptors family 1 profile domain-containing protein n=1 Tax=Myodes glareolus TaxID=447135 RepID=A0AAW0IAJ1_MYOGA
MEPATRSDMLTLFREQTLMSSRLLYLFSITHMDLEVKDEKRGDEKRVITPKMLMNFLLEKNVISYMGCMTQLYLFCFFGISECYMLTAMAYDRYVAICNPLLYNNAMSPKLSCTSTYVNEIELFIVVGKDIIVPTSIILTSYGFILCTIFQNYLIVSKSSRNIGYFEKCKARFQNVVPSLGPDTREPMEDTASHESTLGKCGSANLHRAMDGDRDRDPHWNTGLNSLDPNEKQKEREREQRRHDQREPLSDDGWRYRRRLTLEHRTEPSKVQMRSRRTKKMKKEIRTARGAITH